MSGRHFLNFIEAFGEIKRDLGEMGIEVHTQTMQDKEIGDDDNYQTLELQNYMYTVSRPNLADLSPVMPWAAHEWAERLQGILGHPSNPGEAYKKWDVWSEFLHGGRFSYTYSERLSHFHQVSNIIERLKDDPLSRQLYVSMWTAYDSTSLGKERVPCSLGWHLQCRHGKLNMTYVMRSCDFSTHFQDDIFFAMQLLYYISSETGIPVGMFTHIMFSLHVYKKDMKDVF